MNKSNEVLLEQLQKLLSRKKSNQWLADRLGITEIEVKELKKELKGDSDSWDLEESKRSLNEEIDSFTIKNNYDKGTIEVSAYYDHPPTPGEVIKDHNIDESEYKLSSYWSKAKGSNGWLVSAFFTKKTLKESLPDLLAMVLDNYEFSYDIVEGTHLNEKFTESVCAVLSLQDIHVGKENLDKTGDIEKSVKDCVTNLITRAYHSCYLDKVVLVLGGDLINMDTYLGTTTSQETYVDNSMSAYEAYKLAFDLMFWTITYIKQFCNTLEVVYIPGNHSRLSEAHIAYSLSKCIQAEGIIWDVEYAERKVIVYGENFLSFEHGDFDTKKSPLTFATEWPKQWGNTKFRTLYTGHFHKRKRIEYITEDEVNGFVFRILPSLTKVDQYHYSNKWTGNGRGAIIELHHKTKGSIGEFRYYE